MGLKGQDAADRILVAGIFGWPLKGAEAEKYKIDLTPNPNSADTAHPQIWDYWPVCYDPAHRPKTAGAFDADAWGYGAEGGLRMSAFIDKFGKYLRVGLHRRHEGHRRRHREEAAEPMCRREALQHDLEDQSGTRHP